MRARCYYLRGMTEYRLGHRADALHYLAVAREVAGERGSGLRPEWRQIMDRTLTELTPRGMDYHPADASAQPGATEGTPTNAATVTSGGESPGATGI